MGKKTRGANLKNGLSGTESTEENVSNCTLVLESLVDLCSELTNNPSNKSRLKSFNDLIDFMKNPNNLSYECIEYLTKNIETISPSLIRSLRSVTDIKIAAEIISLLTLILPIDALEISILPFSKILGDLCRSYSGDRLHNEIIIARTMISLTCCGDNHRITLTLLEDIFCNDDYSNDNYESIIIALQCWIILAIHSPIENILFRTNNRVFATLSSYIEDESEISLIACDCIGVLLEISKNAYEIGIDRKTSSEFRKSSLFDDDNIVYKSRSESIIEELETTVFNFDLDTNDNNTINSNNSTVVTPTSITTTTLDESLLTNNSQLSDYYNLLCEDSSDIKQTIYLLKRLTESENDKRFEHFFQYNGQSSLIEELLLEDNAKLTINSFGKKTLIDVIKKVIGEDGFKSSWKTLTTVKDICDISEPILEKKVKTIKTFRKNKLSPRCAVKTQIFDDE